MEQRISAVGDLQRCKLCNGNTRRRIKTGREVTYEVETTENFVKLMTYTKSHVQEAWRTSSRINIKDPTLMYIIFKLQKKKTKKS